MRIMAGVAAAPAIGLPTPVEAAPAPINLFQEAIGTMNPVGVPRWILYTGSYGDTTCIRYVAELHEDLRVEIHRMVEEKMFQPPIVKPEAWVEWEEK